MKNAVLVLLSFLIVTPAFADNFYHFVCRTTQKLDAQKPVTVRFKMRVTPKGGFRYADPNEENIFKVTPNDSAMGELNENGTIRQTASQVTFFGDGDGFVFVYLVLYKNSGFTTGYAKVKDGGGGTGNFYSTVSCRKTELQ